MAKNWFYRVGKTEVGPCTVSQIRELAAGGNISGETLLRREDGDQWLRANRIKGLFPESTAAAADEAASDGSSTGEAAGKLFSSAASTVMGLGGSVKGWLADKTKKQESPELSKELAARPDWLQRLTLENQNPQVVTAVVERVKQVMTSTEEIRYIAVQEKPLVNLFPDCAVLTNRRFMLYRQKMLGRADFEDFIWRELRDAKLEENMIGATFSMQTVGGRLLSIDYLPKTQARSLYRFAQEMEEHVLEERRQRDMEEKRAAAGGVFVQNNVPTATPAAAVVVANEDPFERLQKLKKMLDAGLISAAEFESKKADILSRM